MNRREYGGSAGSPIRIGNRQTEEGTRYRQPPRAPRIADEDDDENPYAYEIGKSHTSAIRYDRPAVSPRRSATQQKNDTYKTELMKPKRRFDRWTLITWLCIAIIVMVAGWFLFSKVSDWWTGVQDNIKYGTPFRTFQADQYVGMGDTPDHPDHFIALNLHGVIEIVQINPRDRKKDAVYVLANVGNDNTPASLSFRDTTGSGHIDVIVTVGDTTPYSIILINNGTTLTPTQPAH